MTPKEKAKELVGKYKNIKINNTYLYPSDSYCKQCALICLDEMLESLWNVGHSFCNDEIKYLEEVKQEIIKL